MLRIDEAMADAAIAAGERIAVLATLPTTLTPTVGLLRERAETGRAQHPVIVEEVIDGAFAAVVGRRPRRPTTALVAAAIDRLGADADVVVLAQASMASAAAAPASTVPVLTSIAPGIDRLRDVRERRCPSRSPATERNARP